MSSTNLALQVNFTDSNGDAQSSVLQPRILPVEPMCTPPDSMQTHVHDTCACAANAACLRTLYVHTEERDRPAARYLILNTDLSTNWGWENWHLCGSVCDCCLDCRNPQCTACLVQDPVTNATTNAMQWFADFCALLPDADSEIPLTVERMESTSYQIDWIRVYQPAGAINTNCDPPAYPTKQWIRNHTLEYQRWWQDEPLKPVLPGGGDCTSSSDCGSSRGECTARGYCLCRPGWVGPSCSSQAAGRALACHAFEANHTMDALAVNEHVSLIDYLLLKEQPCYPLLSDNVTILNLLIRELCASDGRLASYSAVTQACDDITMLHDECSTRGQAAFVLAAAKAYPRCCNTVRFWRDYSGTLQSSLQCRGPALDFAWVILVATAVLIKLGLVYAIWRWRRRHPPQSAMRASDLRFNGQEALLGMEPQALADALVVQMSMEQRKRRESYVDHLIHVFGFQKSSAENQLQHFESLLLSHMSQIGTGEQTSALRAAHRSLLHPLYRWRLQTSGALLGRSYFEGYLREGMSVAHLPDAWTVKSAVELEHEMLLFLIIWGEASNLRFMPECLFFITELASKHVLGIAADSGISPLPS